MLDLLRNDYPRPSLVRPEWVNLNGEWDFSFDFGDSGEERGLAAAADLADKKAFPETINVPFCPESRLSGLAHTDFIPAVWYRRAFAVKDLGGRRLMLRFGAVDYRCTVWINGRFAGEHTGGYSPFAFDITALVREGENVLTVRARDDVRGGTQPHGKQCTEYASHACSYTRTTGIWQTMWLETLPAAYIASYRVFALPDDGAVRIDVYGGGDCYGLRASASVFYRGRAVGAAEARMCGGWATLYIRLSEIRLWDVGKPELYDLGLTLGEDRAKGYFGLRTVEVHGDAVEINHRPVFQRLVLDQGFNPDGIYTAPSDGFLRHEIEMSQALGFNGARLHQRVFEERTLYHADTLGYIVWGEYAALDSMSAANGVRCFLPEWEEELKAAFSHPSVVGWCPFNETYWNSDLDDSTQATVYAATKDLDPTRPCIDASGGFHVRTDIFDVHDYKQKPEELATALAPMLSDRSAVNNPCHNEKLRSQRYGGQPYMITEYGGIYWDSERESGGWGYGDAPKTEEEFAARYCGLTEALLANPRVCGMCYTQLTDVEQERNGLYRYDRERKFSEETYEKIRRANTAKAAAEG